MLQAVAAEDPQARADLVLQPEIEPVDRGLDLAVHGDEIELRPRVALVVARVGPGQRIAEGRLGAFRERQPGA